MLSLGTLGSRSRLHITAQRHDLTSRMGTLGPPAGVEEGVVQVQHQQQLARPQHAPQVGRPQSPRLRATHLEALCYVPEERQPGAVLCTNQRPSSPAAPDVKLHSLCQQPARHPRSSQRLLSARSGLWLLLNAVSTRAQQLTFLRRLRICCCTRLAKDTSELLPHLNATAGSSTSPPSGSRSPQRMHMPRMKPGCGGHAVKPVSVAPPAPSSQWPLFRSAAAASSDAEAGSADML